VRVLRVPTPGCSPARSPTPPISRASRSTTATASSSSRRSRGRVDDLARLVAGALTVRAEQIEITDEDRHRLRLGDQEQILTYPGQLDAALRAPEHERWEWVDEQEPTAAGAL
jgi:hypothetical protein